MPPPPPPPPPPQFVLCCYHLTLLEFYSYMASLYILSLTFECCNIALVKNRCRVCGRKAVTRMYDKCSDPCKEILSSVYNLSVETESDEIFPSSVCHSCYVCLKRADSESDSRPVLHIPTWLPHSDSCQLCFLMGAKVVALKSVKGVDQVMMTLHVWLGK